MWLDGGMTVQFLIRDCISVVELVKVFKKVFNNDNDVINYVKKIKFRFKDSRFAPDSITPV